MEEKSNGQQCYSSNNPFYCKGKNMRPTQDEYFMEIAKVVAKRSTCARRSVGCVLMDQRKHILATGYNGVAAGRPHCIDEPCPGACSESGTDLDLCEAIHAEQNALLQCPDVGGITVCYVTVFPCVHCTKLLLNTGCRKIVYAQEYPNKGLRLWLDDDRLATRMP